MQRQRRSGLKLNRLEKAALSILVIMAMAVGAGVLHYQRDKIDLSAFGFVSKTKPVRPQEPVHCSLVSSIGSDQTLVLEMAIPCRDPEQQHDIQSKLSRVKSDFFVNVDQAQLAEWIRLRNYPAIKNEFLKIINRHAENPVTELYFESFLPM